MAIILAKFSPPALVGEVRGRVSELAGGVIIRKDKAPPRKCFGTCTPPKAEGEMGCGTCTPPKAEGEMGCGGEIYSCLARQQLRHKKNCGNGLRFNGFVL